MPYWITVSKTRLFLRVFNWNTEKIYLFIYSFIIVLNKLPIQKTRYLFFLITFGYRVLTKGTAGEFLCNFHFLKTLMRGREREGYIRRMYSVHS